MPVFGVSLGRKIIVVNKGDNTLKIYPSVSGTIDGGSTNDAITLGINKKVELICTSISGGIALWHSDLVNQLPSSGIVTSVGLTVGTSGSDVAVSGSPITSSGTITLNIPDAGISKRGVVNAGAQTFLGPKTFEAFFIERDS